MDEASKDKRIPKGKEKLSLETTRHPRDLLQMFMASNQTQLQGISNEEVSEEIELSLGLSLGGRFGVDKSAKKLLRSSSIASFIPVDDEVAPPPAVYQSLVRTSSLPTEAEGWRRKRKELQTLRRMEAKRRRSEKQRNLKNDKDGGGSMLGFLQPSGSVESQGGSSSGMSESESRPIQGSSSHGEPSPVSIQSLQEQSDQEAVGSALRGRENAGESSIGTISPYRSSEVAGKRGREIGSSPTENMPFVFTQGDGPNGRKIEGILYKYGKGEEVRIMCTCHANFLSPAEFVKHAGGSTVTNPLKQIVVAPCCGSLL
ncbi:hypothetical protein NMG60_11009355 [Bertholletia excelsa]